MNLDAFKNYSVYLIKLHSQVAFAITTSTIKQMYYSRNNGKKNGKWQTQQRDILLTSINSSTQTVNLTITKSIQLVIHHSKNSPVCPKHLSDIQIQLIFNEEKYRQANYTSQKEHIFHQNVIVSLPKYCTVMLSMHVPIAQKDLIQHYRLAH